LQGFKLLVGKIANDFTIDGQKIILQATSDIIATQKTIHPSEQEAMGYINKKLKT